MVFGQLFCKNDWNIYWLMKFMCLFLILVIVKGFWKRNFNESWNLGKNLYKKSVNLLAIYWKFDGAAIYIHYYAFTVSLKLKLPVLNQIVRKMIKLNENFKTDTYLYLKI